MAPVVEVLKMARTSDRALAICATNFWLLTVMNNILFVSHIMNSKNKIADFLSRWVQKSKRAKINFFI